MNTMQRGTRRSGLGRYACWIVFAVGAALGGLAGAQTTISFWHSMAGAEEAIQALADGFNAAQDSYFVEPEQIGSYTEGRSKILAAISSESAPVLFQSEIGFFPRLVEEGVLHSLSDLEAELNEAFIADFYPGLWSYGRLAGERYGLPFNSSTPVLFYNATALEQRNVDVPMTWEAFELAAAELTTRRTRGYIAVADSWTFEMMVNTRGGRLVTESGRPNFISLEAIDALNMLKRMVDEDIAIPRSINEVTFAQVDFIRTKAMMVFASIANWPEAQRFAVAFEIQAAPVPTGVSNVVPLGGAQLVVLNSASEAERQGAWAFWQYLMQPENIQAWVEASYYIPLRRSALPLLEDWYEEDPNRRAALEQLETAIPRPRLADYITWAGYLEEAIEKTLKSNTSAENALAEAQRRAEENLP